MSEGMKTKTIETTSTTESVTTSEEDAKLRQQNLVGAIQGLIKAAHLAQSKGAFTFEESQEVHKHIKDITKKE